MKLRRLIGPLCLFLSACAAGAGDGSDEASSTPRFEKLLVIGDSISLGEGALGTTPKCKLTPKNNSITASYGAKLAAATGAQMELWAWSGHGLVRNYQGFESKTIWHRVQDKLGKGPPVDVDLIVVNVGTNDFAGFDPGTAFADAYQDFLARLTGDFPKARILVLSGPMLSGEDRRNLNAAVSHAVQTYRAVHPQKAVEYLRITDKIWREGPHGCQYHPSEAVHAAMVATILEQLAQ